MKKLAIVLAAAAAALILATCTLEAPAQGHVTITVPRNLIAGGGAAKVLDTAGNGAVTAIRLYIELNGSFLKQSGDLDYFQANLSASSGGSDANTITLDLPPTSGYKIRAALGTTVGGWQTLYFGETGTFTVAAGVFTTQNLGIQYFAPALLAQTPTTVPSVTLTIGANSYWLEGAFLKGSDGTSVSTAAYTVSSLSKGLWFDISASFRDEVWLNTSQGLVRLDPSHTSLSAVSTGFGANAVASGAIVASLGGPPSLLVYYFGKGKDLGIRYSNLSSSTSTAGWTSFDLLSNLTGANLDLVNKITKDLVTAIVQSGAGGFSTSTTKFIYVASALGLFNRSGSDINSTDFETWFTDVLSGTAKTLQFSSGGKAATVGQLALDGGLSSPVLYAGTDLGLFATAVAAADGTPGSSTALSMGGSAATAVAAFVDGPNSYAAALDDAGNLFAFKNQVPMTFTSTGSGNVAWAFVPFYAGLPSKPGSLSFFVSLGQIYLRVAGEGGYSVLLIGPATPS